MKRMLSLLMAIACLMMLFTGVIAEPSATEASLTAFAANLVEKYGDPAQVYGIHGGSLRKRAGLSRLRCSDF